MRVDMVERVAMLVRTAARAGQFKITEDMLSLAGATREAMGLMLLDLGCHVVGEEPFEDPAKPAIQIFEKQRKAPAGKNRQRTNAAPRSGDVAARAGVGKTHRRLKTSAAPSRGKQNASPKQAAKPNPDSPFAVLAELKLKN